eukprot:1958118-Amphidinium_carterae.1
MNNVDMQSCWLDFEGGACARNRIMAAILPAMGAAANYLAGAEDCSRDEGYRRALNFFDEWFAEKLNGPTAIFARAPQHDRVYFRRHLNCGSPPEVRSQEAGNSYCSPTEYVGLGLESLDRLDEHTLPPFDFHGPVHTVYHAP